MRICEKKKNYQSPIYDTDELKNQIKASIQSVGSGMLHSTWLEISYRHDMLRESNDAHIKIAEKKKLYFLYGK